MALRAILQESEAKLEMKIFNPPPPQFLCGGRLPWTINKNNHIWIGRCIVAMVTTLDHVAIRLCFDQKIHSLWFSGARERIQMKFVQMVQPLSQFIKITVKKFWVL